MDPGPAGYLAAARRESDHVRAQAPCEADSPDTPLRQVEVGQGAVEAERSPVAGLAGDMDSHEEACHRRTWDEVAFLLAATAADTDIE